MGRRGRRIHDDLDHIREICLAFEAAPTVDAGVKAARRRARELLAARDDAAAAKKPVRKRR